MPWDDTSAGAAVDDSEDDDSDPSNYFSLPKLLPGLKDLLPPAGVPDNPAAKYSPEVERLRPWALSQTSNPADAETWLQGAQTDLDQQAQNKARIKAADDFTSQQEREAQGPSATSGVRPADTANDARIASNAAADAEAASEAGKHSNNPLTLAAYALNPLSSTSLLGRAESASRIPKITDFIQNKVQPAVASGLDTGLNAAAAVAPALEGIPVVGPLASVNANASPEQRQAASKLAASQIPSTGLDLGLTALPALGEAGSALAGSETAQRIGSALADETGAVRVPGGKVVPEPGAIDSAQRQLQWLKDNTKDADLSADAKKLVDVLDPQTAALSMAKDPAFVPGDSNAVKTWLEDQSAQQKATPAEYGAPPPESLVPNPHAPAVDAATGEHILYHGTAGPLEGDQLKQDSFLTPHREDAQTIANLQSRLTGGEPNVVELRAHPDAVRPMNESQSFAASRGAMQVSDPNGVRVVNPEAPTPIRPDVQVEPPSTVPPRFTDSVLNAVQQSKGYSDADMAIVKRLGNDPMEAMQFTIDNPAEAARLKPILADAVEAQRQSDSGLASGFHRDTAVVRNRASEMSSRMEASSDAAQGNANDNQALPRGAAGENGPGGRAPLGDEPVTPGPASPGNGIELPAKAATDARIGVAAQEDLRRRLALGADAPGAITDPAERAAAQDQLFGELVKKPATPAQEEFTGTQAGQRFETQRNAVGSERGADAGEVDNTPMTLEEALGGIKTPTQGRLPDRLYQAGKEGIRNFADLINAPITTATFGHAPLFRQGIGVAVSHAFSAWAPALKGFYSILRDPESAAAVRQAADDAIADLPEHLQPKAWLKNAGSNSADPTFVRQMLGKVGLTGNRMQEAASQYLDSLRKFAYKTEAQRLIAAGRTDPAEYSDLWDVLSHATGHPVDSIRPDINLNPAFSWNAMKGRFLSLSDVATQSGSLNPLAAGARATAMRNLIGIAGFGTTVMVLDQLTGGKANWNIGAGGIKTKVGLTTLDPYAGMGSIVRLFAGAEQAVQKGVQNGETVEQTVQGMVPLVTNFARGQISPGYQYIASLLTGKDWKQRDVSWAQSTRNLLGDSAPIAAKSIYDAVTENLKNGGPNAAILGGLRALPGLGALGVETNQSLTDVRDKATTTLGLPDKTDPTKKAQGYNDLTPANQMRVNAQDDVKSYQKANPTTYDTAKAQELDPIAANQAQYEQAFKDGTLTKPITDLWHDTGVQKAQAMKGLVDTYLSGPNFTGNADAFRKDINDYFNQTSNNADTTINWEATDAAQQKFLATLPPTRAAAVKDYLAASQENQTPLRQQYLDYVSKKDAAGYYKPGVTAAERSLLDAKNPTLDAQAAYFSSGQKGVKPQALQSAAAVSQALQADPSLQYHLAGMTTAVNATAGTKQAFDTYGKRASDYLSGALVERNQDSYAQNLYGKKYASLTQAQQTSVSTRIKDAAIKSAPDLEAYLAWMGERQTISQAAEPYLQALRQKYGKETVDQPIRLQ